MIEVRQTATFRDWMAGLRDQNARRRILQRVARLELGLLGDVKTVGGGISELRVDHGPGYRVYFMRRGGALIVLLCGGDKSTQAKDIARAKSVAKQE
jgi:putative addiction module killer protein